MVSEGRKDRKGRLDANRSGVSICTSQEIMCVVKKLFKHSAFELTDTPNFSEYTIAAIPLVFSSLRCLSIEHSYFHPQDDEALSAMKNSEDFKALLEHYKIEGSPKSDAELLYEVRNEILHATFLPTGTPDHWPDYLRELKEKGILLSTPDDGERHYAMYHQICSHQLFEFAFQVSHNIAKAIVTSHPEKEIFFERYISAYELPCKMQRL